MTELMNKPLQTSTLARYDANRLSRDPQWLAELRTAAIERFGELGFPTRRDEDWRYTPIAPIVETPFVHGDTVAVDDALLDGKTIGGAHLVVLVNGHFSPALSQIGDLPSGVVVESLASAIERGEPLVQKHLGKIGAFDKLAFTALNTASISDGVFVRIPRGTVVEWPVHIVAISQPGAEPTVSHPRALVVAGENSQATIVERYIGPDHAVYFTNSVSEYVLAENAHIDHYKVQQESGAAYHVGNLQVLLARSSNFMSHSFGFGSLLARSDAGVELLGEACTATLNGLFMADGHQLMDNHTMLDHAMPYCPSHQIYKHILDGHSRGVFNGRIYVHLDAQKTDAKQTNQTLLLSKDAEINTKPQLEIFADDVKCTHGATVGQLSGEQFFYLRSRGIGKEQAQDLLIYAFASDVIQRVKIDALREELDNILLAERHIEGLE